MPISDEQREEFHRRYEQRLGEINASRPLNWDEMSREEKNKFYGFEEMAEQEVNERYGGYGHSTITFIGVPKLSIARGDVVMVQEPSGRWQNRMVAVGGGDGVDYVAAEDEYQQAQAANREPLIIAYPAARVKLADGGE
jgi:hypothetical protein